MYRGDVFIRTPTCCDVLCWFVALAVRTKTKLAKTNARPPGRLRTCTYYTKVYSRSPCTREIFHNYYYYDATNFKISKTSRLR